MQVTAYLRNKVARRIALLFILCALLPVSALGVIAYSHVTSNLSDQAHTRLRQASKATGMAIYERMLLLEAEMQVLVAQFDRSTGGFSTGSIEQFIPTLSQRYKGIALSKDGAIRSLIGRLGVPMDATEVGRRHLRAGKTLIGIRHDGPQGAQVFLSRLVHPDRPEHGIIQAEVNGHFLWLGGEGVALPASTELCVFDPKLTPLFCSFDHSVSPASNVGTLANQSAMSSFEWQDGTEGYLAGSWSIPLRFQFGEAQWTVVLSEAKRSAFAPLEGFTQTFVLVIVLTLCVVTLFSVNQIRSRLNPLEELERGTRRIAERDFASRVAVTSDDEFGSLGRSFNWMAEHLGRQFQMLDTMGSISRAILSSYDSRGMVKVVLAKAPEALACEAVAVGLVDSEPAIGGTLFVRSLFGRQDTEEHELVTTSQELAELKTQPHYRLASGTSVPRYLDPLVSNGLSEVLLFPILVQEDCAGVLVLGYRDRGAHSDDDISHGRQLADQVSVAISNLREITKRIQADAEAQYLANYDPLTRLPNRQLFHRFITNALALEGEKRRGAVLLVNLDRFQRVNDTFGPRAGDWLLEEVAGRIDGCVRKDRTMMEQVSVARLGSDQFGVLLTHLPADSESARVAQVLLTTIGQPYQVAENQVFLTASVGIALLHIDGKDADLLIRNADTAMRAAKEQGRNLCQFYSESMNRTLAARMALEQQLRVALEREEFLLHYQPQIDVSTGTLLGAEALIRWRHPERGFVSPAEFIPIAEEDEGLIAAVGEWVLRTACRQQRAWRAAGLPPLELAINISALHFRRSDFVQRLETILQDTGAETQYLELELTETVLMNDSRSAVATLKRLRTLGIKLAMDDFGTGYSSLAYLKQFPVDKLKIDRAFVQSISSGSEGCAIAAAIIAMGHALKLRVLAEGVETHAELSFLREQGCHSFQGFLFSKPLPVEDMTNLLRTCPRSHLAKSA